MPSFRFMLSNEDEVREAGVIQSESFAAALRAIGSHITPQTGDTLEVGVTGFPPVRYACVSGGPKGRASWVPTGRLAA